MKQSGNLNVERSAPHSDADNPWPGLAPFTEAQSGRFFGREAEIKTLARRVQADPLTVLFGQSGLGKSSLLQAGVFPRLRSADFCPIYIRLDHGPGAPTPAEQVKELVKLETARMGRWTKPEFEKPGESLWEFFHHRDHRLVSPGGIALSPVLVFDQFEELFTLGGGSGAERERAVVFITGLAELVENRPPEALEARLEQSSDEMDAFDFSRADYRVIITLREDYLPHLEGLKATMPTLMDSRMRLTRMNGAQALEAVVKPGAGLVTEEVGRAIVEFVAGARGGSAERLAELDVEPPLLSVICRELNERRRALGQPQITADLVSGNRREILHDFYERSVADLPEAMRRFVENKLLTKSGFRDNLALEAALEEPGVTQPLIDQLVSRRLLRIEDRIGTQRVELTHDVLADVVRASRDARQQQVALEQASARERLAQRRHRTIIAGLSAAVIALLVGAFFGIRAQRRAEQAARDKAAESSRTDFIFGSALLEQQKTAEGLAYLGRAVLSNPHNHAVATRLLSALASRNFAEPVGVPLVASGPAFDVTYAGQHGKAIAHDYRENFIHYWDLEAGRLLKTISVPESVWSELSRDATRVAVGGYGNIGIWELATGRPLFGPLPQPATFLGFQFSPNDRWFAAGGGRIARVWDAVTGELKTTLDPESTFRTVRFSADSTRLITVGGNQWRIFRVPSGEPLTPSITLPVELGAAHYGAFSPDGKYVVVTGAVGGGQLYDAATAVPVGTRLEHTGITFFATFSSDGKKVATPSTDGTVKLWEVPTGKLLIPPLLHGGPVTFTGFTHDQRWLVTGCDDGTTRVWNIETGRYAVEPIRVGDIRSTDTHLEVNELMTGGSDNAIRRWRLAPSALVPLDLSADPNRLEFRADSGLQPAAWTVYPDHVQRIDLLTGRTLGPSRSFPVKIRQSVVAADGRFMCVRIDSGEPELWDLRGEQIIRHPLGRANVLSARFSADGSVVAVQGPGGASVWRTDSGQPVAGPIEGAFPDAPAGPTGADPLSEDGTYLAVRRGRDLHVFEIATSRQIGEAMHNRGQLFAWRFSPDARQIATVGDSALLWDVKTGRTATPLPQRTFSRGVAFSRDGRRVLTWSRIETRIWEAATGRPLIDWVVGGNDVFGAAFTHDETRFVTYARTGREIRIWDSATGRLLSEPFGIAGNAFGFSADDRFLISGGEGRMLVWPIPPTFSNIPTPNWLLRLGSAFAGGEIDGRGLFRERALEPQQLAALRAELAALPKDAPYAEWGRWILADRATRPIGPGFKITAAELARLRQPSAPAMGTKTSSVP